jgi:hypothetical protein
VFGSPPASTVCELPSVLGGLRGWPRRLCILPRVQRFGRSRLIRLELCNFAGPQHFCHLRGLLRVGARIRAGCLAREVEPSLPVLPWPSPNFRASFVLRDSSHSKSKTQIGQTQLRGGACDPPVENPARRDVGSPGRRTRIRVKLADQDTCPRLHIHRKYFGIHRCEMLAPSLRFVCIVSLTRQCRECISPTPRG